MAVQLVVALLPVPDGRRNEVDMRGGHLPGRERLAGSLVTSREASPADESHRVGAGDAAAMDQPGLRVHRAVLRPRADGVPLARAAEDLGLQPLPGLEKLEQARRAGGA